METKEDLHRSLAAQIEQLEIANQALTQENKALKEKLFAALDGTGLFIWEQHVPSGKLSIYNQTFGSMCGYSPNELEATVQSWENNLHPDDKEAVLLSLKEHLQGQSTSYEAIHRMIHKDGGHTWVSDRGRVIEYSETGEPLRMMGTHVDITLEKKYELYLAKHANLDPLTNLLNRKALNNAFDQLIASPDYQGGAFLFIDLDDFKQVNDNYGHKTGDEILLTVAKELTTISPENAKIARFGGDEFIILCNSINQAFLASFPNKILTAFQHSFAIDDKFFDISLSIGICTFRRENEDFNTIFEQADRAMYKAKLKGKNNFCFW